MVITQSNLKNGIEEALSGWRRIVVLGVGNELGGDDALGLSAAKKLKEALAEIPNVEVLATGNAPENFTGLLRRLSPSHILLIDAAEIGGKAGTIKLIKDHEIEETMPSTHSLPLYLLINYLKKELGSEMIVLGIQPKMLSFGTTISSEVECSLDELVLLFKEVLGNSLEAMTQGYRS
ncbi:MAG: hydrogenase maturation peptidase HycI [Chloroflexota bacterium]|nr:hydrogenase maturation peptidase HycI [Chloroflexota bacterium]